MKTRLQKKLYVDQLLASRGLPVVEYGKDTVFTSMEIAVFWSLEEVMTIKDLKKIVLYMQNIHIQKAILLLYNDMTWFAKRIVHQLAHPTDPNCKAYEIELIHL